MGLKLVDLLRWSKEIVLVGENKEPIIVDGKEAKVFMRIIGDHDLQESYKSGRIRSASMRKTLQNRDSDEYLADVRPIEESGKEAHVALIIASKRNQIVGDANANVERPDLPKIEEVAADPDAPSLEEQERLDALIKDTDLEYEKKLEEYVDTKLQELDSVLHGETEAQLCEQAVQAMVDVKAFEAFLVELREQKTWRATYMDKTFREKAFDSIDEYRSTATTIKNQLADAYSQLELNPDDVKN